MIPTAQTEGFHRKRERDKMPGQKKAEYGVANVCVEGLEGMTKK